jgi:hypothetical protein
MTLIRQPSLAFESVLANAYQQACRIEIAEIGTDLVLSYAARRVPAMWTRLPYPWHRS